MYSPSVCVDVCFFCVYVCVCVCACGCLMYTDGFNLFIFHKKNALEHWLCTLSHWLLSWFLRWHRQQTQTNEYCVASRSDVVIVMAMVMMMVMMMMVVMVMVVAMVVVMVIVVVLAGDRWGRGGQKQCREHMRFFWQFPVIVSRKCTGSYVWRPLSSLPSLLSPQTRLQPAPRVRCTRGPCGTAGDCFFPWLFTPTGWLWRIEG